MSVREALAHIGINSLRQNSSWTCLLIEKNCSCPYQKYTTDKINMSLGDD